MIWVYIRKSVENTPENQKIRGILTKKILYTQMRFFSVCFMRKNHNSSGN